ncbi:hypothetical protein HK405_004722 [Cladochytrium tenue]|nr:hypothetical protein HK405_004722 [Cladochytrium tenue]
MPQWRKIIGALIQNNLPLDNVDVRALIRMAAYQTGNLSGHEQVEAIWHSELQENGVLVNDLLELLGAFAERLKTTPRDHASFPLLAELAAFIAQYAQPDLRLAYRDVAIGWASDIATSLATSKAFQLR